ncbi:MAG TPA: aldo/keto reductase [Pirellulales bacterium]|nr:aldo/keto reductase [Pirellulales bacterium]
MSEANRRDFLISAAAGMAASNLAQAVLAGQEDSPDGLPKRELGKTGQKVSIIALGGWHIGAIEPKLAVSLMHEAIDNGLTFFDNAWDYHDGGSERVMGEALASGGRREKVFLMTKNCNRDYAGSLKNLDESLSRLKTDHLDLWQFHEINYDNDPDWVFEKGGLKAALEAQKAGKVRYIGFTGHKHPELHLRMIDKPYAWATAQMPINLLDANYRSFQKQVVPVCNERGIGVLGMKSLGGGFPKGKFVEEAKLDAITCRRYALSLPISSLVVGITSREDLQQELGIARNFKPMPADELAQLVARTRDLAGDGRYEWFKSTQSFDGPYHRKQHGFPEKATG